MKIFKDKSWKFDCDYSHDYVSIYRLGDSLGKPLGTKIIDEEIIKLPTHIWKVHKSFENG